MSFLEVLSLMDTLIWCPFLVIVLVFVGLYFTIRLRFLQVRRLGLALRCIWTKEEDTAKGDVSPLASLCTALSATVGTGNIVGMATAVVHGGPGALFWMSVAAFLGMATKYAESLLAVKYRTFDAAGNVCGGPMITIDRALGKRWLARLFALFGLGVALLGIGTFGQVKSIVEAAGTFHCPVWVTTLIVTALVAAITLRGIQGIAHAAEKIVPSMCLIYLLFALVVLVLHGDRIPDALSTIVVGAFCPHAMSGGALGFGVMKVLQMGIARGIYSNESGLGSAPIAAAAAKTSSPVRQGFVSMTGTFFSLVICMVTGLVLVVMQKELGLFTERGAIVPEALLTARAFDAGLLGTYGTAVVNSGILFFAFTTILGWNYYGEVCFKYLLKGKYISIYRGIFLVFLLVGPFLSLETIFIVADIVNGLMALPNLVSLFALRKEVIQETRKGL